MGRRLRRRFRALLQRLRCAGTAATGGVIVSGARCSREGNKVSSSTWRFSTAESSLCDATPVARSGSLKSRDKMMRPMAMHTMAAPMLQARRRSR